MEFQKRLYFAQEDIILSQRKKEAEEEAKRVNPQQKKDIIQKWDILKKEAKLRKAEENARKSQEKSRKSRDPAKDVAAM